MYLCQSSFNSARPFKYASSVIENIVHEIERQEPFEICTPRAGIYSRPIASLAQREVSASIDDFAAVSGDISIFMARHLPPSSYAAPSAARKLDAFAVIALTLSQLENDAFSHSALLCSDDDYFMLSLSHDTWQLIYFGH